MKILRFGKIEFSASHDFTAYGVSTKFAEDSERGSWHASVFFSHRRIIYMDR